MTTDQHAADLVTPRANRLQKPSWKDTRLIVGVLLVLLAIVLGARTFAAAGQTTPVYVAAHALVPGQQVSSDDVRSVQVRLAGAHSAYLSASSALRPGTYVLRQVGGGELIPRSALGASSQLQVRTVSVPVDSAGSSLLRTGSVVDVWVDKKTGSAGNEEYRDPKRILQSAVVAHTPEQGGALSVASATSSVQIVVPDSRVQQIIAAVDAGAKVTLVPANGSPTPSAGS